MNLNESKVARILRLAIHVGMMHGQSRFSSPSAAAAISVASAFPTGDEPLTARSQGKYSLQGSTGLDAISGGLALGPGLYVNIGGGGAGKSLLMRYMADTFKKRGAVVRSLFLDEPLSGYVPAPHAPKHHVPSVAVRGGPVGLLVQMLLDVKDVRDALQDLLLTDGATADISSVALRRLLYLAWGIIETAVLPGVGVLHVPAAIAGHPDVGSYPYFKPLDPDADVDAGPELEQDGAERRDKMKGPGNTPSLGMLDLCVPSVPYTPSGPGELWLVDSITALVSSAGGNAISGGYGRDITDWMLAMNQLAVSSGKYVFAALNMLSNREADEAALFTLISGVCEGAILLRDASVDRDDNSGTLHVKQDAVISLRPALRGDNARTLKLSYTLTD